MVALQRKLANVMGGKNARACDNCIRKRARWYCPADDAFLCQICDGSVHSANPLARRHERVRLKTSSLKPSKDLSLEIPVLPSWHHGFTKKARTPRGAKHAKSSKFEEEHSRNPLHHLVPEICCDEMETSHEEENEEQLLYRVPIFDPFVAELCTTTSTANSNELGASNVNVVGIRDENLAAGNESKAAMAMINYDCSNNDLNHHHQHQLHGSLPSEMELAEFAADVESLLGKGLDDESFDIEGLGFSDCKVVENSLGSGRSSVLVKVEDEGGDGDDDHRDQVDMMSSREALELSFDYDSPATTTREEDGKGEDAAKDDPMSEDRNIEEINNGNGKILLRLDYDGVISAWNDQRSPWTAGERPDLDSLDCWPDHCMGGCGTINYPYGEVGIFGHPAILFDGDGGREARVSRYREKRRTRLFAKKIRYEVRKLNAEKRPRMKGRFVKRSNFSGNSFPLHSK